VLRCLALKSSGKPIGFRTLPAEQLQNQVLEAKPTKNLQQSAEQLKFPLQTATSTVSGRTEQHYAVKTFPFRRWLTVAKSREAYQHLFVVFQLSCPPCFQRLGTDQSGRTPSHRSLMRSWHTCLEARRYILVCCLRYYFNLHIMQILFPHCLTWKPSIFSLAWCKAE